MNTSNRFILILGIALVGTTALVGCSPQQSPQKDPKIAPTNGIPESGKKTDGIVSNSTTCNQSPAIAYADAKTQKVSEIARAVTVCITSQTPGSGVIIKRQGNVYTILTAAHVVATEDKYKVVAPDGKQYAIDYKTIKRFPGKIDLAILQFTSDQEYRVVEIEDSTKAVTGTPSYVAGFPLQSAESTIQNYRFSDGQISANASRPLETGYALSYLNDTFSGMSGGPVLDEQGKLIGIHGQSKVANYLVENKGIDPETGTKFGLNLAIPIHTFMSLIAQVEPALGFQPVAAVVVPSQQTADDVFLQGVDKAIAGKLQEAITDFDQAIRLNPNFAVAYYSRGSTRRELGDKKGAITDFDQAIRLNPNDAGFYSNRGVVRNDLGDKKGAIADYTQAIRLDPNFAGAYYNRGTVRYSKLGDRKGAIADFDQAIRLNPNFAGAYSSRGVIRNDLGDKKGAITDYTQAIRLNPNFAVAYFNRGFSRNDLGDKKGAITDYTQAIRLNPKYAEAYGNLGIVRADLGDEKGAIADFDQAIRLNPNLAHAYGNRGLIRYHLRDKQRAIADLQKAADLYQTQGNQAGYQHVVSILGQINGTTSTTISNTTWQKFSSSDGGFSVLMPGKPQESIQRNSLSNLRVFIATQKSRSVVFEVNYNLTNIRLTDPANPSRSVTNPSPEFFKGFGNSIVGKGRLLKEQDVRLNGYSGREIIFQTSDGLFNRIRLYYANQRFYTLRAVAKTEAALSQESDQFFNSFTIASAK
jgi:tetratricopeptide (TPR) repeat protein/S1-C subfamily serine protease